MKKDLNNIQGKVSKAIEKIRALTEIGQRSMSGFHLNDHPLKNAVSVVGAAAPYEVSRFEHLFLNIFLSFLNIRERKNSVRCSQIA